MTLNHSLQQEDEVGTHGISYGLSKPNLSMAVTGILIPVILVLGTNFFVENFGPPGPIFFENNGPL